MQDTVRRPSPSVDPDLLVAAKWGNFRRACNMKAIERSCLERHRSALFPSTSLSPPHLALNRFWQGTTACHPEEMRTKRQRLQLWEQGCVSGGGDGNASAIRLELQLFLMQAIARYCRSKPLELRSESLVHSLFELSISLMEKPWVTEHRPPQGESRTREVAERQHAPR